MKKTHKKFIKKLRKYLKDAPDLRVTQALYNLGVTLGIRKGTELKPEYYFIDNYNETDEVILKRMKNFLKHGKKQKIEKRIEEEIQSSTGGNTQEGE